MTTTTTTYLEKRTKYLERRLIETIEEENESIIRQTNKKDMVKVPMQFTIEVHVSVPMKNPDNEQIAITKQQYEMLAEEYIKRNVSAPPPPPPTPPEPIQETIVPAKFWSYSLFGF